MRKNGKKDENMALNPHVWRRMASYFLPYMPQLILAMALAVVANVTDLLSPYIMGVVIDEYIGERNPNLIIWLLGAAYFASVLAEAASQFFRVYILNSMGQKIIHNIRMQVFSHIQRLPFSFFDRNPSGSILTRATNDVEALSELYIGVVVALFKDALLLIGIVGVMLAINVKLALVSFSVIPVIAVITIWYNRKAKENFRWVRSLIGRINAFFAENISGMRLVQIFSREKEKFAEFKELNDEYNKASVFGVMLNAVFKPASEFINSIATTILIWFCARDIINGAIDVSVLYIFITYTKKFFAPINDLADKYSTIQSGSVSAERIFELLDEKDCAEDLSAGKKLKNVKGKIEFKNVWFAYIDEQWVLKDVSFVIEPGETVAFVGATGSGKTTIISLISRFYHIQKGEILLDGININEYSLESLRRGIAVVMQDVFLFAGDIRSNIRLNNDDISDDDIVYAARYVNASDFIEKLPSAYGEAVKERGATLSSGQRQLLSFARAVAFKPAIMVLDEATANIDTENEMIIQESLEKISKDRTTIIIAHRLSTISNADNIIVLHKGRIRETGRHEELLALNGIYRKLYELISS